MLPGWRNMADPSKHSNRGESMNDKDLLIGWLTDKEVNMINIISLHIMITLRRNLSWIFLPQPAHSWGPATFPLSSFTAMIIIYWSPCCPLWSYTDRLLVFLTDHYCYASSSSSGLYTTIIKIKSPFLFQKLFSLFNLDHKNRSSLTHMIQKIRTMLSRFSSTCLFLAVSSVSKDQFLISLWSLPSFYMNSNLAWD